MSGERRWGPWRLHERDAALEIFDDSGFLLYDIELAKCSTSGETLGWLMQIADKMWATDEVLAGLVRAFNDCAPCPRGGQ